MELSLGRRNVEARRRAHRLEIYAKHLDAIQEILRSERELRARAAAGALPLWHSRWDWTLAYPQEQLSVSAAPPPPPPSAAPPRPAQLAAAAALLVIVALAIAVARWRWGRIKMRFCGRSRSTEWTTPEVVATSQIPTHNMPVSPSTSSLGPPPPYSLSKPFQYEEPPPPYSDCIPVIKTQDDGHFARENHEVLNEQRNLVFSERNGSGNQCLEPNRAVVI